MLNHFYYTSLTSILAPSLAYCAENKTSATSKATAGSESLVFGFLPNPPPSWIIYIGISLALITFLWKIFEFSFTKLQEKKSKIELVQHQFWFDTVLIPTCVKPLLSFAKSEAIQLIQCHADIQNSPVNKVDLLKAYQATFRKNKENIIASFLLFETELYSELSGKIDELDDIITNHCASHILAPSKSNNEHFTPDNISRCIYKNVRELLEITLSKYKNN